MKPSRSYFPFIPAVLLSIFPGLWLFMFGSLFAGADKGSLTANLLFRFAHYPAIEAYIALITLVPCFVIGFLIGKGILIFLKKLHYPAESVSSLPQEKK